MPWYLGVLLTVFVPLIVLNMYIGWKLTRALSEQFRLRKRRTAIVLGAALIILHSLPIAAMVTFWTGGRPAMSAFAGESLLVDVVLVYPFWTTLIVVVQSALLLLVWDIVRLIGRMVFRGSVERWGRADKRATFGIVLVVLVYTIPTLYVQTRIPRVNEHTVAIPEHFRALDGLKILHMSDVQGDGRTNGNRIEQFVQVANDVQPDLVMNSGDIVTTGDAYIEETAAALSGLTATIGRYAAVGDHDIFSGNKGKVLSAMRASGHTMLEDTSITIAHNGATIGLTFITYTYPQRPSTGTIDSLLILPDSVYRILLVHQPAEPLVTAAAGKGYDLVLAGHTHGGGVAFGLPGIGLLAPASFETRFLGGLYTVGTTVVNVTTGLGFTLAPVRFNAPIEVSLLTLKAEGGTRRE